MMSDGRARSRIRRQEHRKTSIRTKVKHPFRVIKREFGLTKVWFKALPSTRRTW